MAKAKYMDWITRKKTSDEERELLREFNENPSLSKFYPNKQDELILSPQKTIKNKVVNQAKQDVLNGALEEVKYNKVVGKFLGQISGKQYQLKDGILMNEKWDKFKKKDHTLLKYIALNNYLYGTGDEPRPLFLDDEYDPFYMAPEEFDDLKKTIPISPMVKKEKEGERFNDKILKRDKYTPKKKIVKKTAQELVGEIYDVTKPKNKKEIKVTEKPKKPIIEILPGLGHFDWEIAPWEDYPEDDDYIPSEDFNDTAKIIQQLADRRLKDELTHEGIGRFLNLNKDA